MPLKKSKKLELAIRRQRVAELHLQGWTQQAIAEDVGIVQSVVFNDLKHIRKEWRESAIRDFDAMRDEELRRLERIERESWEAWERSQKPAQSARIAEGGTGKGHKTVKGQVGNPKFLDVVLKCIESRRSMLGLDAPTKVAQTTPDGKALSSEERQTVINAILIEKFGMTAMVEEPSHDSGTIAQSPGSDVGRGPQETKSLVLDAERVNQTAPSTPSRVSQTHM